MANTFAEITEAIVVKCVAAAATSKSHVKSISWSEGAAHVSDNMTCKMWTVSVTAMLKGKTEEEEFQFVAKCAPKEKVSV